MLVLNTIMLLTVVVIFLSACGKPDVIPEPTTPPGITQPENGFLSIKVTPVITIGDVVYDSIPSTFTITSWDANNLAIQKGTALDPGALVVYLPALPYAIA